MNRGIGIFALASVACLSASLSSGQEVRRFEKDGVIYEESKTVERKPISNVQWQERTETVLVNQQTTELQQYQRTVYVPVVSYTWEPRVQGLLNPFTGPYLAYHLRPNMAWQARTETVQVPVVKQQTFPEQRVVRTPVCALGFVNQPVVTVTRLPSQPQSPLVRQPIQAQVVGPTTVVTPYVATRPGNVVGGVAQYDGDLPRQSTSPLLLR